MSTTAEARQSDATSETQTAPEVASPTPAPALTREALIVRRDAAAAVRTELQALISDLAARCDEYSATIGYCNAQLEALAD